MLTALATPALFTPNGDGSARLDARPLPGARAGDRHGDARRRVRDSDRRRSSSSRRPGRRTRSAGTRRGSRTGATGSCSRRGTRSGSRRPPRCAVIVDRTLAGFRSSPQVFSPNSDGRLDTTRFRFTLDGPARATSRSAAGSATVGQVFSGQLQAGPRRSSGTALPAGVGEHEFRADLAGRRRSWRRVTSSVRVRDRHDRAACCECVSRLDPALLDQRAGRHDGCLRRHEAVTKRRLQARAIHDSSPAGRTDVRGRRPRLRRQRRPAAQRTRSRDPVVVGALEPSRSSTRSSTRSTSLPVSSEERRRGRVDALRQVRRGTFTLMPIPSTTRPSRASARMPAVLRPATRMSFGSLISGVRPVTCAIASAHGLTGDERQLRKPRGLDRRFEQEREEQAHSGRRQPAAPEPSAALGLLLGQRDGALGVLVSEQPLRRRARVDEEVRMPETARAGRGNHGFRPQ